MIGCCFIAKNLWNQPVKHYFREKVCHQFAACNVTDCKVDETINE